MKLDHIISLFIDSKFYCEQSTHKIWQKILHSGILLLKNFNSLNSFVEYFLPKFMNLLKTSKNFQINLYVFVVV
jgi:hypothetical protein